MTDLRTATIPLVSFFALALAAMPVSAQSLTFYLSKQAIDCIAENRDAYIAAKLYDFTVIRPAECPAVPDTSNLTVGNEYLEVPAENGGEPTQPETMIVPLNRLDCLQSLAEQLGQQADDALFLVDLDTCAIK